MDSQRIGQYIINQWNKHDLIENGAPDNYRIIRDPFYVSDLEMEAIVPALFEGNKQKHEREFANALLRAETYGEGEWTAEQWRNALQEVIGRSKEGE